MAFFKLPLTADVLRSCHRWVPAALPWAGPGQGMALLEPTVVGQGVSSSVSPTAQGPGEGRNLNLDGRSQKGGKEKERKKKKIRCC